MSFVSRRTFPRAPSTRLFLFAKKKNAQPKVSSRARKSHGRSDADHIESRAVGSLTAARDAATRSRRGREDTGARAVAKREREDSMGLDHLPPNHWARQRAPGNYLIAGTLLGLAGATYMYTMHQVQKKDDVDLAIEARTSGKK